MQSTTSDFQRLAPSLLCVAKDEHPLIRGLRWILANRKQPNGRRMSMRALSVAAGLSPSHVEQIINLRQSPDGVGLSTLQALAAAAQVRLEWLQTGEGVPDAPDATPPTPPAKSDVRPREAIERDDVEVEGWFFETLQELGGKRRYTKEQVQAAKAFLMSGNPLVEADGPRKIVLGALEAARELDLLGNDTSPEAILALLITKNAPPSGVEPGARTADSAREYTVDFLAKERKNALKGFKPKKREGS